MLSRRKSSARDAEKDGVMGSNGKWRRQRPSEETEEGKGGKEGGTEAEFNGQTSGKTEAAQELGWGTRQANFHNLDQFSHLSHRQCSNPCKIK